MKTAIIGASGYSGEELVRLLSRHPQVELALVSSRSLVGKPLVSVMPKFRGLVSPELVFSDSDPAALAARDDIDVFFLALHTSTCSLSTMTQCVLFLFYFYLLLLYKFVVIV